MKGRVFRDKDDNGIKTSVCHTPQRIDSPEVEGSLSLAEATPWYQADSSGLQELHAVHLVWGLACRLHTHKDTHKTDRHTDTGKSVRDLKLANRK